MHREIDRGDELFGGRSDAGLYLMTGLMGLLIALDLWPSLAAGLNGLGLELPYSPLRTLGGYRFALIAAVVGGARVLFGALERLLEGKLSADLATAIACLAAILIKEYLVAAEVIFIGLAGECLEAYTFARTQRGVRKLVEVFPIRCWVLRDGAEVRTLTADLSVGDQVVVKPGAKIPADGVVLAGRSSVDTSALTGESLPVECGPGSEVLAGGINQTGQITLEARRVSQQTVAGRVLELTARALRDKAPLERQVDRLAKFFLPAVLGLALITFLANWLLLGPLRPEASRLGGGAAARQAVYPTLAVLVVACPCALVLATPAAVIAALGRLAGTGVLIKGGSVLEKLAQIDAFAFDKTGTLTEGRLELATLAPAPGVGEEQLLAAAAFAEQGSEHPLARMVLAAAAQRGLSLAPLQEFQAHPGGGVSAAWGGEPVTVGSARLLAERGCPVPDELLPLQAPLDAAGEAALWVARGSQILGVIGGRDRVRPEAADAIARLKLLGLVPIQLLSGDRPEVVRNVAAELKIDSPHASLLPAQKAEFLPAGNRTAFVGDGINDAPALARAHVGIAIGTGTDVAAETGDVVMMGDPLRPLPLLVALSRETIRVIRQNVIWFGFGVNLVGVLLTAWLWPLFSRSPDWLESAPLAGVVYHQLGSLLVLLNSMRLLGFARAPQESRWGRLQARLGDLEAWAEQHLRIDALLHEIGHHFPRILRWGSLLLLVGYLLSGLVAINVDEVGVVQRFGRVQEEDLPPGLHWRWPWPVERVTRVKPRQVRTVEIGFRTLGEPLLLPRATKPASPDASLTWASAHSEEIQRLSDESILITGDGNLVELLAAVHYRVADPRAYLFAAQNVEGAIRSAAESILRELVGAESFTDLLTTRRTHLQQATARRLALRLEELSPGAMGVELLGVTLHDLHPPQEVVASFHAVAKAIQARDQAINQAQSLAIRKRRRAEETAYEMVRQAESRAHEKVQQAQASRDTLEAWHQARHQLQPEEQTRLLLELLHLARQGADPAEQLALRLPQVQAALAARRRLTEFRLAWDALTEVLRNRDKIIVDADRLPGRRQLFLFDPTLLPRTDAAGPSPAPPGKEP